MKLLDLFCGAGGGAFGYHLAGFDVVGIDIQPQPHYPFKFIQADAFDYVREHGHEFDVIHASPPCQAYTGLRNVTLSRFGHAPDYPDLIDATRLALCESGKPWIIENVQFSPLRTQFRLCGASMGLPGLARHRHFESSELFLGAPACTHRRQEQTIGVYGARPDGRRVSYRHHRLVRVASSIDEAKSLMGIDWMSWDELTLAIPPAYTVWIGRQLLEMLSEKAR